MSAPLVALSQADGDTDAPVVFVPEWTVAQIVALMRQTEGHLEGDCFPLAHRFAPGVYAREITMPAGFVVVGKQHRTTHFNIISKGRVSFWVAGQSVQEVCAPYTFVSEAGVQKVLYIHEETVWTTIHPTDETDLTILEGLLIDAEPLLAAGEAP